MLDNLVTLTLLLLLDYPRYTCNPAAELLHTITTTTAAAELGQTPTDKEFFEVVGNVDRDMSGLIGVTNHSSCIVGRNIDSLY